MPLLLTLLLLLWGRSLAFVCFYCHGHSKRKWDADLTGYWFMVYCGMTGDCSFMTDVSVSWLM